MMCCSGDFFVLANFQRSEIVSGVLEVEGETEERGDISFLFILLGTSGVIDRLGTLLVFSIISRWFHAEEKGVPDFWLKAMKNNEILAEEVGGFSSL